MKWYWWLLIILALLAGVLVVYLKRGKSKSILDIAHEEVVDERQALEDFVDFERGGSVAV